MMKFLWTVLYTVFVASLIGSALGDPVGGDLGTHTSAGGEQVCDVHLQGDHDEHEIPLAIATALADKLIDCPVNVSADIKEGISSANTTEEYRKGVKGYCDNVPTITACTGDVIAQTERCLNAPISRSFKYIVQYLNTFLSVACEDDGVKTASILEEIENNPDTSTLQSGIRACLRKAHKQTVSLVENDTSQVTMTYYHMIQFVRSCIIWVDPNSPVFNNLVDDMLRKVLSKLKCVHPFTQAEVICQSMFVLPYTHNW